MKKIELGLLTGGATQSLKVADGWLVVMGSSTLMDREHFPSLHEDWGSN
jgi:hypothetical protein